MAKRLFSGTWSSEKAPRPKSSPDSPPSIFRTSDKSTSPDANMPGSPDSSFVDFTEEDEEMVQSILQMGKGSSSKLIRDSSTENLASVAAPKVSFTGIDSPQSTSSLSLSQKTNEELIAKIRKMELDVTQAQIDLTAEKTIRKKKERNLVKLAKELNKRSKEKNEMNKELAQLKTYVATLETKLQSTRMELGERVESGEGTLRRHQADLELAHQKYRDACREHDARVSDLVKTHSEETQDLRRQMQAASDESDQLRSKLIRLQVKEAEQIAERAVEFSGGLEGGDNDLLVQAESRRTSARLKRRVLAACVVVVAALYQVTGLDMDAVCSPVMAGTRINREATYEAPWWAPESMKESAFEKVCGNRPRTSLSLSVSGHGASRIVAKSLGQVEKVLLDRKGASAIVKTDRLELMLEKNGKVESIKLPWAL